jgi:PGF-pre-PGF domain-containing protein
MPGKVALPLCIVLLAAPLAGSTYTDPGARAMGMAGAFDPLSDDGWGHWFNPAGLIRCGRMLISAEYTNLYPALDDGQIHYGAASYLQPFSDFLAAGAGYDYLGAEDQLTQGNILASVAARPGGFPVSIGLTGRYIFRDFADNEFTFYDPLFARYGREATGMGLDVGMQAAVSDMVTLSASGHNLTRPDLGLESEDRLPLRLTLGAAFHPELLTPVVQLDYSTARQAGDTDLDAALGLERWLGSSRRWAVRAGYRMMAMGRAHSLSAGFTARYSGSIPVEVSYAFRLPLNDLMSTVGQHRVGLSVRLAGESWGDGGTAGPIAPGADRRVWNTESDVYRVELWANRDVTDDRFTVGQFEEVPANVELDLDENLHVYGYFPVSTTVEAGDVRDLSVRFRVPRTWLEINGLEERLVRLYRVEEETLTRMPAALFDEDDTYLYYEADLDRPGDLLITSRSAELVMIEPQTVYGEVDSVDILEATLRFRVSKLWIDENRVDPATIGLTRVRGGVAGDVDCRLVDEDLDYLYFETDPVNLFQFMLVAKEREGLPMATIYFDVDSVELRDAHIPDLDRVVQTLRRNPGVYVSVEGHADSDGTFGYNAGLSRERALNVAEYLRDQLEDTEVDIEAVWYGERRPAATNETEEGRAKNRRVEIVILRRDA